MPSHDKLPPSSIRIYFRLLSYLRPFIGLFEARPELLGRVEMRELLDPDDDNRNWSGSGFHQLQASARVLRAPQAAAVQPAAQGAQRAIQL